MSGQSPTGASEGRTQRERRARTEEKVLDAAVRLIAAGGSGGVSLAQVGTEAGYSRGIVTHQFGTRDELLRRVALHAQEVFSSPETGERGLTKVLSIVDTYLQHLVAQDPVGRAFLLMWVESVASEGTLRTTFQERDGVFRETLIKHLKEGLTDKSVRPNVQPAAAAVVIIGQLRGIGLQLMQEADAGVCGLVRSEATDLIRRGFENKRSTAGP